MSALTVRGIAFQPLKQQLFAQRPSIEDTFSWLSEMIGEQTRQILSPLSDDEKAGIDRHFLCSTMVELAFTTGHLSWETVAAMLAKQGEHQPDTYINAYECASWGYSLRHYLQNQLQNPAKQKSATSRFLLVSIIDANVYDLEFWRYNENWHESGFGITTVLLEVTGELSNELIASCAKTYNSMAEFATVVRRTSATRENCTLAMPFFPDHIQQMFDKLLAEQPRLADRHGDWGHCFGSDPWLSILTHSLDNPITEPQQYLACSLALNGYYAMAEVTVTPQTQLILQQEQGYA